MEPIKDFYTITEFAKKLSVHANTIRKAVRSGRISAFKFGSDKKATYRIPHSEIQRIMLCDLKENISNLIQKDKKCTGT